ncbi:hypothetical protein RM704_10635 [Streptomyces sp. DSM 3412]|uniref:DUF7426 domain-containing protein n=1 Tax=Streptomyces gottesmaniae TaxID=3075518 RepID=A0ABU2YVA1_9ACTN|nr:hypothetical protein [Streptomyces sp. DSM 3412]MDT0567921.1 hypothetical protein [Streptomyces sp. DSM 3412]
MAGTFEPLDNFLDDYLELPVVGRDGVERMYRIEDPSAEDGIRIERITSLAARLAAGGSAPETPVLNDDEERDLYRMCLGDAYDALLADGVRWSRFKHVALTAMFWVTTDKDTAREFWKTGQQPGKAPNRAARRQAKPRTSESDAGSTTPSQGSTSGTRAGSQRRGGRGRPHR